MKFLNLGCGQKYHKDWLNIDFVSNSEYVKGHNLLKGIPLNDESVDVVYHSHVLEHFSKEDGYHFIRECFRVLTKDGVIRIAVPDLEVIVKEYLRNLQLAIQGDKNAIHNYEWIKLELFDQMLRNTSGGEMGKYLHQNIIPNEEYVFNRIGVEGKNIRNDYLKKQNQTNSFVNNIPYKASKKKLIKKFIKRFLNKLMLNAKLQEPEPDPKGLNIGNFRLSGEIHQWMYDRYSLSKLLLETGFRDVKVCSAFQSSIKDWDKYELDVTSGEVRKPDSLFIEARKK